jgi:hypothetical protein
MAGMPSREMPSMLADEIASSGPWRLSGARLRPTTGERKPPFAVSIAVAGHNVWSDVALEASAAGRQAAAALKRSGYEILQVRSKPFHARRLLYGSRELDAEVRRLAALATDAPALASFPLRRPRPAGLPSGTGPFAIRPFERLRQWHGWSPESVSVARMGPSEFVRVPGWTAGAWCLAVDDGNDRLLTLHIQAFSKSSSKVDPDELARLTRALGSQLRPLGYKAPKIHWPGKQPQFAVFEKALPTLAAARRERRVLDRALFGD